MPVSKVYLAQFWHRISDFPELSAKPFNAAVAAAGIEDLRFHDLRHTAATYLAQAGATEQQLRAIGGRKSGTVSRYVMFADQLHGRSREKLTEVIRKSENSVKNLNRAIRQFEMTRRNDPHDACLIGYALEIGTYATSIMHLTRIAAQMSPQINLKLFMNLVTDKQIIETVNDEKYPTRCPCDNYLDTQRHSTQDTSNLLGFQTFRKTVEII